MESAFKFMPEAASEFAKDVDLFYYFLCGLTVFFTLVISLGVLYLAVKYRRRSHLDRPEEVHGNNVLEITWTVIPFILAMIIFFWATHLFFQYARTPKDAMEILVTGKQWIWKIQHPDGKREVNELHIPAGQNIKLTMTSEDVIHSFFIPAFRTKMDVVPGRYTATWFRPEKPGKYHLFCAEYCGTEHSEMVGSVYVMPPAEYEAWLAGGGSRVSPVAAGEKLFADLGCVTCHSAESGSLGPNLVGVFGSEQPLNNGQTVIADENYIRESILNPNAKIVEGYQPVMATFKGLVSETQLMQIIAYIKSLAGRNEFTQP